MTTLIAVYNSDGCVGRCDANCYLAVGRVCDCICGGMNHGCGRDKAIEYTRALVDREQLDPLPHLLEQFAKGHGLNPNELVAVDRLQTPNTKRAARLAERTLQRRRWAKQGSLL